jgi:Flp pilus assembly protein TadD
MNHEHSLLEQHLAEGHLDRAESVARHLLGIEPDDVIALVALARIAAAHGRIEPARHALEDLAAEHPRAPEPLAYLAVLAAHGGQQEQALALARRSLSLGGDVGPALTLVADDALDKGELQEADGLYDRALAKTPTLSGAWLGKGRILAFKGRLADAEDAYIQAVQHGPQRVDAWIELVRLEREGGAHDIAAENLVLALRTHPGHPELVALAQQTALEDETRVQDPARQALQHIRALLYRKDHAGALLELERLLDRAPGDKQAILAEAEVTAATGKGDSARLIHELTRWTREEPNAWEPRVALGQLFLLQGSMQNPRLAAAHCEDAWRASGEAPRAGLALVEAWAAQHKLALARALCERLAEGDSPESAIARAILAGEVE